MARRWRGSRSFRRLMRNLPDAMHGEMADAIDDGSRDILAEMVARAPSRRGALRAGLKRRVLRKTLRARIGLIGPPKERNRLFYARILDLGRKAQSVRVKRRKPKGGVSAYVMKVRAIAGKRFITGRMPELRTALNRRLKGIWDRALKRVSGGDDA